MAGRADTWMPLYIGDYLTDTTHLTTEQHGAYLLLLMTGWKRDGVLPADDEQLAAIVRLPLKRWRQIKTTLAAFFTVDASGWQQKRQIEEIERAKKVSSARQEAGKLGGKAKANARQTVQQKPTPSQSQSQKEEGSEPKGSGAAGADFDPEAVIFDHGRRYLESCGVPALQARSLLGKWRKALGDGPLIDALGDAKRDNVQAPIEWMEGVVRQRAKRPAKSAGYVPMGVGG